ncbi:MAG: DUF1631 domain-containing protein [Burkholderiaceae bacterium]|nr:DUF1631 domain-containing protein [Burkholderiaceae bacterium]
MTQTLSAETSRRLARAVRERYVAEIEGVIVELGAIASGRLRSLAEDVRDTRQQQSMRDANQLFAQHRAAWVDRVRRHWRRALGGEVAVPSLSGPDSQPPSREAFSLVGDAEVDNRIAASRLTLAILDKAQWQLNDLRLRIQHLQKIDELPAHDVLKPDTLSVMLLDSWTHVGLTLDVWRLVAGVVQPLLVERTVAAYHHANDFLVRSGVLPEIDLKSLVRRSAEGAPGAARPSPAVGPGGSGGGSAGGFDSQRTGSFQPGQTGGFGPAAGATQFDAQRTGNFGGSGAFQASGPGNSRPAPASLASQWPSRGGGSGGQSIVGAGMTEPGGMRTGLQDETRMLTVTTPLARARQRAQGVLVQLRRFLGERVAGFEATDRPGPSPAMAQAMGTTDDTGRSVFLDISPDSAGLVQISTELRERTAAIKRKAATPAEKATVEIVALMFQAILAEERIPAAIRVWFARLQMPVLRVAMAEPEFFGTLQHPARQLIDRLGSAVMGFDAAAIEGGALEAEVRRVVQVIEQYPETGRRVFQLVLDEFKAFLAVYLTEGASVQKAVSVAQQVEQKETLSIQYTIELRKMLNSINVRDEIRDFLFKVWAEVLAMAAVRHGPQHPDTLALKRTATDLLWAASAKPSREERTKVIHDLPGILARLRQGMGLLGLSEIAQNAHLKVIGDTLSDAFLSRTENIPRAEIDDMARRLERLEEVVLEDVAGDIPLNPETVELMLGMDASSFEVLADGGSKPTDAMVAWVAELVLGDWFMLDHNATLKQVQLLWRSDKRQLHLFASADGRHFLIQGKRLAAYLQAGLLVPVEEEALTVRATRDAMAKLDANPERLLS